LVVEVKIYGVGVVSNAIKLISKLKGTHTHTHTHDELINQILFLKKEKWPK